MEEEPVGVVGWYRFAQLLECPSGSGMGRHIDVEDTPSRVFHEQGRQRGHQQGFLREQEYPSLFIVSGRKDVVQSRKDGIFADDRQANRLTVAGWKKGSIRSSECVRSTRG
jgi:hypothetical protein